MIDGVHLDKISRKYNSNEHKIRLKPLELQKEQSITVIKRF